MEIKIVPSKSYAQALGISPERVKEIADNVKKVLTDMTSGSATERPSVALLLQKLVAQTNTVEEAVFVSYKAGVANKLFEMMFSLHAAGVTSDDEPEEGNNSED